ncbi:MAG: hypothetical protein GY765_00715 [bacterium]|nr:hypothetical protein [bacterium]
MKNKDVRDIGLLLFMIGITLLFLLYIFLPDGESKNKKVKAKEEPKKEQPVKETPTEEAPLKVENKVDSIYKLLGDALTRELNTIYNAVLESNTPFEELSIRVLQETLSTFPTNTETGELMQLSLKFGFRDLPGILQLPFPESFSGNLKFKLYLSLFLIKLKEERMVGKVLGLPAPEFKGLINFDLYKLVNDEIQEDYQALPVLFYFTMLMRDLHIYPVKGDGTTISPEEAVCAFFVEKAAGVRDLSPAKLLNWMKELCRYSRVIEPYRIDWVEKDGIGANDKKAYGNLHLKTYNFLRQKYMVFPDFFNKENNRWVRELSHSDPGDIEPIELRIVGEMPTAAGIERVKKIYYSAEISRFIVLLKEYESPPMAKGAAFLDGLIRERLADFHKNMLLLDYTAGKSKDFKKDLNKFGNTLKQNKALQDAIKE